MHPKIKLTAALVVLALGAATVAPMLRPISTPAGAQAPSPAALPVAVTEPAPPTAPVEPAEPAQDPAPSPDPVVTVEKSKRDVDIVLVVDTSGSMQALLDSARSRLWDIVNDVSQRERNAHLRVAVLAYGTPDFGSENGYVKVLTDLTDNLDGVYGHAMSLVTNGGDEFVGWAAHTALERLSWSTQPGAARIVFVAGNESARQGSGMHDFRTVCAQARERKIVMNALYAGPRDQGLVEGWGDFASACGGVFTHIDMAQGTVQIATPQDIELQRLNQELNATYLGYGALGASGSSAQSMADLSSSGMGASTFSSRVASKGSAVYDNSAWDLVDGVKNGVVDLAKLSDAELPANLQGMTPEQRKAEIARLEAERARIQAEIRRLAAEREQHLKAARKNGQERALDVATEAMLDSQL